MAKVVFRSHIDRGWYEYDVISKEVLVEENLVTMHLGIVPGSFVYHKTNPRYWWALFSSLPAIIRRRFHRS